MKVLLAVLVLLCGCASASRAPRQHVLHVSVSRDVSVRTDRLRYAARLLRSLERALASQGMLAEPEQADAVVELSVGTLHGDNSGPVVISAAIQRGGQIIDEVSVTQQRDLFASSDEAPYHLMVELVHRIAESEPARALASKLEKERAAKPPQ